MSWKHFETAPVPFRVQPEVTESIVPGARQLPNRVRPVPFKPCRVLLRICLILLNTMWPTPCPVHVPNKLQPPHTCCCDAAA